MRLLNLSMSQLLWVFIATKLLTRLKPSKLFLRWLASYGLKSYRVPTDEELRKIQYSKKQEKKDTKQVKQKPGSNSQPSSSEPPMRANEFKIRCSDLVKLNLTTTDINYNTLNALPLGDDLEWRVDFAFMALVSFLLTQTLFYFSPRSNEYNFSLVWIFLIILQCLTILIQISAVYFQNKKASGERSIVIVAGILFLLLALFILSTDGTHLELKVDESIQLLSQVQQRRPVEDALLDADQIDTPPPTQAKPFVNLFLKLTTALFCSVVGAILTFPGFRFGQMHESILADATTSKVRKIICNINLLSPLVVVCLWIPNISRNPLKKQAFVPIDDDRFETIRLYILILTSLLRFIMVRRYIAAFLLSTVNYRLAQLRRKCGFTSNKTIQLLVSNLNIFTNAATIQYILPTILCLFTSIMFASYTHYNKHTVDEDSAKRFASLRYLFGNDQEAMIESAEELMFRIRRVFSSELAKNLLGFATWWIHFAWLCTTSVGVAYYKYFEH